MLRWLSICFLLSGTLLALLFGLFQFFEATPVQNVAVRFGREPQSPLAHLLSALRAMAEGHWREPYLTQFLLSMAAAGLMAGAAFWLRRRRPG
ncbi:hypothetical protein EAH89_29630 [Roseomonas nepalensis]|uniref:Uncharacterized protein n=1 Tax=Muricoccus nepalensis TaxID=1854500 RepID=A0A502EKS3_9PROT|nr:hypothetical protein [Roseomonas nepalensis]TPG38047.1 hypothetical protein EAH89_29630 [Roseomonas nepalensis]